MKKVAIKNLCYLGVGLGLSRIFIGIITARLHLDIGYFFDIFIFVYLNIWLLFSKHHFSLKKIILMNIFISLLGIIIFDFYILIFKYQGNYNKVLFIGRVTMALYILAISFLSSLFYYLTQHFFLKTKDK